MQNTQAVQQENYIKSKFGYFNPENAVEFIFPEGVFGFPKHKKWYLIRDEKTLYFNFLQSMTDEDVGLILIHKNLCLPNYECDFYKDNIYVLELTGEQKVEDCELFFVVTIPEKGVKNMTINCQGPICFNLQSGKAGQLISKKDEYDVRVNLIDLIEGQPKKNEKNLENSEQKDEKKVSI